ncbi:MAG: ABC transporter permease [Lachnospiraceae bacterium]|nr:ABC transporter permease [Lachnospiraceae bacterium]
MFPFIKCCSAELKKGLKELPYALLGMFVLCLILGTVAFCAARLLYQQEDLTRSDVAIVTDDIDDDYLQLALNLINNMDSTSLTMDFHVMSDQEARLALQKRQIIAILFLPEHLINGILYGSNPPIHVLFATNDALSSVFLTETTLAGARLLSGAQAAIYAAGEIHTALGMQDALSDAYDRINRTNLNYALNREKLFIEDATSLQGTRSTAIYYAASGILLVLLFITTAFSAMLRRESRDYYQLLFSRNISSIQYLLARICSFALFFFLLQILFYLIASSVPALEEMEELILRPRNIFRNNCLIFFLINSFFLATYANMIFLAAKDVSGGILISYSISSLMAFCSGCIIPAAFFPVSLQKISAYLPTYYLHKGLIELLEGSRITLSVPILIYPALFFLFCMIIFCCRRRYNHL